MFREHNKKKIIFMWEWDKEVKNDKWIHDFIKTHCATLDGVLSTKDALKGGRTECLRSLYKCSERKKIWYYYIPSLYPWVMAKIPLPVGPSNVFKDNFPDMSKVQGVVDCTVDHQKPWVSVLEMICHTRLMFDLCRTWMEQENIGEYKHDSEQRMFRGLFC